MPNCDHCGEPLGPRPDWFEGTESNELDDAEWGRWHRACRPDLWEARTTNLLAKCEE